MMAGVIEETIEQKLKRHEDALVACMAEIERLRAENECLKVGLDAHSTLKSIYSDSNQPAGLRIKAAAASLPHETPRLTPVPPPLDLVAEEVIPLAQLVEQRRARQNALQGQEIEVLPSGQVLVLKPGGNGTDDSDHS